MPHHDHHLLLEYTSILETVGWQDGSSMMVLVVVLVVAEAEGDASLVVCLHKQI